LQRQAERSLTSDITLSAADAYARSLTKHHYENFVVASGLVRSDLRLDLARIYAFCRTTDDLGDESLSTEDALARLERWQADVQAMFAGETPVHPVLYALRETIARKAIAAQPFLDLIEANRLDQRIARYDTWPELDAYCRLSAAPVGRMVLAVFGVADPRAPALSDDVCIGLQLANHAQDVKRDAAIGRRYLLGEDLAQGSEADAVRSLVARARRLLDSGRMLEPMVHFALRLQLSLYRLGGLAICDAIEQLEYRTAEVRPTVSGGRKAGVLLRGLLGALHSSGGGEHAGNA
jgi:squalene synthase HpnC